ncbi:unnamed protein product [Nezara viridula]|uniref:Uncharacterized protein n=1 Tax=Nezara viridula TaxID=85310 RepID=A0A9P0MXY6_NEZVI|nr:unnamed protein product [Nezara viridula]
MKISINFYKIFIIGNSKFNQFIPSLCFFLLLALQPMPICYASLISVVAGFSIYLLGILKMYISVEQSKFFTIEILFLTIYSIYR